MPVFADLSDNRITLSGWLGPQTPTLCKSVGAGTWHAASKRWRYPLNLLVCRRLRKVFGADLKVSRELSSWAASEIQNEQRLLALKDPDAQHFSLGGLAADAPALASALRPYQRSAIAFGSELEAFGLFDQPGLGKSAMTIGVVLERDADRAQSRHLVLCPKIAATTVWPAEVARWAGDVAEAFVLTGTRQKREKALADALASTAKHVFVCGNIEMTRDRGYGLHDIEWDTVVIDESHRALVRKSVKSESQQRKGITSLRSRSRIALSGTPMRGKPQQLWGTLNWLRPDLYRSYWNFVGQFFEVESDRYSAYILGGLKDGAEEEMQRALAPLIMRRTKAEVAPELPPKSYVGSHLVPGDENSPFAVWLTPTAAHLKQYEKFCLSNTLTDNGQEIIASGALAEYTRRSQLATALHTIDDHGVLRPTGDSAKLDWLREKIEELGIPNEGRIVVASHFTRLINVFAEELRASGIPCHVLTGETSDRDRERICLDFQSETPSARVFFLNTQAGGVAITLDAADDLVLLDETTNPDDQEQVEDRIHRVSRNHNVTIYNLRCLNTQDEEIAWVTAARADVQQYLLDGSRGVAKARKLYEISRSKDTHQ